MTRDEHYPVHIVGSKRLGARGLGDPTWHANAAKGLCAEGTRERLGPQGQGRPPEQIEVLDWFRTHVFDPLLDAAAEHLPRFDLAGELGPQLLHEQATLQWMVNLKNHVWMNFEPRLLSLCRILVRGAASPAVPLRPRCRFAAVPLHALCTLSRRIEII